MNMQPSPFTLRQLQYAVAVADELSFRRAAERCRVAQPSLSAQLAQLEDALGLRLFERDRRRVLPTPAGAAWLERARALLVASDDLVTAARAAADPFAATLRLGVIPTIAPYLLPRIAPALHRAFAKLTVVWLEDKTDSLVEALHAGGLDAALVALEAPLGPVAHEIILQDPFVLAARSGDPLLAREGPMERSALRDAEVLLLDDGHCLREQALSFCSRAKAREREFRATSITTLVQMVGQGSGVTLLPSIAVDAEAPRASLVVRPFAEPAPKRTIALVWREQSALAAALTELASVIKHATRDAARYGERTSPWTSFRSSPKRASESGSSVQRKRSKRAQSKAKRSG